MRISKNKLAALVMMMAVASAVPAFAQGWEKKNNTWYYTDKNGNYVTNTWKSSNNGTFYLGDNGAIEKNALIEDGDARYYVNDSGARVTNTWVQIEEDDNTYWYYFGSNGKAVENGTRTIDGKRYHFQDFHMLDGWSDDDSDHYYGSTGWNYITDKDDSDDFDEGWYYTDSNGKLVKGQEKKIKCADGKYRYFAFNDNGLMCDNWVEYVKDNEIFCKYYEPSNGYRADGWVYFNGEDESDAADENRTIVHEEGWYYLKNGRPYTATYNTTALSSKYGTKKIGSKTYCFDESGKMVAGVVKGDNGEYYYFGDENDGAMKTGRVKVLYDDNYGFEGETMYFASKGTDKGTSVTGVKDGYLYKNGERVESESGWEIYTLDGKSYVINENGKVKKSGTFTDDNDVKWKITGGSDAAGYTVTKA